MAVFLFATSLLLVAAMVYSSLAPLFLLNSNTIVRERENKI